MLADQYLRAREAADRAARSEAAGWLVAHGVPASRLQAYGYGDAGPVAPNTPAGQPLNRRVDVIIDPALP